jgi:hypothetical protein
MSSICPSGRPSDAFPGTRTRVAEPTSPATSCLALSAQLIARALTTELKAKRLAGDGKSWVRPRVERCLTCVVTWRAPFWPRGQLPWSRLNSYFGPFHPAANASQNA